MIKQEDIKEAFLWVKENQLKTWQVANRFIDIDDYM
jgi:hypothetical protein